MDGDHISIALAVKVGFGQRYKKETGKPNSAGFCDHC